ncbi:transmembrane protein 176, partial [Hypanus sabinus]|uniref:transmembrane protein 176 n=1 Tax=Hypanus sabinus TaxID=79690 RepID=UPI0028C38401
EPISSVSDGQTAESDGTRCQRPETAGVPATCQVDLPAMAPSEMSILWNQLTVLGAMQILLGMVQLVFGVSLYVSMVYSVAGKSGVSFWTGFWFIVSGGFTIQLRRQPTRWNVKAGVVTNGVSIAATVIAVIMYSVSLLFMPPPEQVYFSATTFSLSVGLLLFTLMEMILASVVAFYSYKRLFQFESTYTIL